MAFVLSHFLRGIRCSHCSGSPISEVLLDGRKYQKDIFTEMPLFSNKFSPKKATSRRAELSLLNKELEPEIAVQELGPEVGPIKLKLGDQESLFDNGEWIPESGPVSGTHKENQKLKRYVQQLEDENNLLKLKFEILLDMLTQTTAESHLQEKQIEQLQKQAKDASRIPTRKR